MGDLGDMMVQLRIEAPAPSQSAAPSLPKTIAGPTVDLMNPFFRPQLDLVFFFLITFLRVNLLRVNLLRRSYSVRDTSYAVELLIRHSAFSNTSGQSW